MTSFARNEKKFLRNAKEAITHMKNLIYYNLANELHLVTITRGYCFLRSIAYTHLLGHS